jgi:hypothetical protein
VFHRQICRGGLIDSPLAVRCCSMKRLSPSHKPPELGSSHDISTVNIWVGSEKSRLIVDVTTRT